METMPSKCNAILSAFGFRQPVNIDKRCILSRWFEPIDRPNNGSYSRFIKIKSLWEHGIAQTSEEVPIGEYFIEILHSRLMLGFPPFELPFPGFFFELLA